MKLAFFRKFAGEDDGAVTVDWVVLTAAIVGLAVSAILATETGVMTLANTISVGVSGQSVGTP